MPPVRLEYFMQVIQVRGIAVAVQSLKIVTLQKTLGDVNLLLRHAEPGVGWKHRHFFSWLPCR